MVIESGGGEPTYITFSGEDIADMFIAHIRKTFELNPKELKEVRKRLYENHMIPDAYETLTIKARK